MDFNFHIVQEVKIGEDTFMWASVNGTVLINWTAISKTHV